MRKVVRTSLLGLVGLALLAGPLWAPAWRKVVAPAPTESGVVTITLPRLSAEDLADMRDAGPVSATTMVETVITVPFTTPRGSIICLEQRDSAGVPSRLCATVAQWIMAGERKPL